MEDRESNRQDLSQGIADTYQLIRRAFMKLPVLSIEMPRVNDLDGVREIMLSMTQAAEAMADLPGPALMKQAMIQSCLHWVAGVCSTLIYGTDDTHSEATWLAAKFSLSAAEQDIEVAVLASEGLLDTEEGALTLLAPELDSLREEGDGDDEEQAEG